MVVFVPTPKVAYMNLEFLFSVLFGLQFATIMTLQLLEEVTFCGQVNHLGM